MSTRDISWEDIDARKFFFYQSTMLFSVRALLYPNNVVKTHLQTGADTAGIISTYKRVINQTGYRGLWRGFLTYSVSLVPAQAIYVSSLEIVKHQLHQFRFDSMLGLSPAGYEAFRTFVSGGLASCASQTVMVPADVISSRLMIQGSSQSVTRYAGGWDGFKQIIKADGLKGLYRGYFASVLTFAPFSATW